MELALGLFLSALGALLFVVQAIVVVMAARLGDWANAAELVVGALFAAATAVVGGKMVAGCRHVRNS